MSAAAAAPASLAGALISLVTSGVLVFRLECAGEHLSLSSLAAATMRAASAYPGQHSGLPGTVRG